MLEEVTHKTLQEASQLCGALSTRADYLNAQLEEVMGKHQSLGKVAFKRK